MIQQCLKHRRWAGKHRYSFLLDRERLWNGINDGTVSTVCTDHAPWTLEEKLDPSLTAATLRHGMAELETMMPVLWSEGVVGGRISV